jgi:hypothetical protein
MGLEADNALYRISPRLTDIMKAWSVTQNFNVKGFIFMVTVANTS